MLRLTREVRFAINDAPAAGAAETGANSYAGMPALRGWGRHYALRMTVAGQPDRGSCYLVNVKDLDHLVRTHALPLIQEAASQPANGSLWPASLLSQLLADLSALLGTAQLHKLELCLTPTLRVAAIAGDSPMTLLSQKFEFSASHRLHNPQWSDQQNRQTYGKCNNPHGHGHNYELQVTLGGRPDAAGLLMDIPAFERIVQEVVIERFDHRNLNVEIEQFRQRIPTVENIAQVIYELLLPHLRTPHSQLVSVTVWETAKTWCEYGQCDPRG